MHLPPLALASRSVRPPPGSADPARRAGRFAPGGALLLALFALAAAGCGGEGFEASSTSTGAALAVEPLL